MMEAWQIVATCLVCLLAIALLGAVLADRDARAIRDGKMLPMEHRGRDNGGDR